ncbi:hypothetical protein C8F04DRAFT_1271025 [Mycena alexandri]|uniref:Uncharacterized protein n=1 Tax=Mycena alexandri TaxID=1745969 RepID=A0AAD6SBA4_9AGAR|nr:hypothetical protein C8F04DRAFT_1271025 [Mycena alexandri]
MNFFLAVTADTTIGWIKDYLEQNKHISTTSAVYFTAGGRRASIVDTMESLGLGELSYLQVNLIVPGGASTHMDIDGPRASSSRNTRIHAANTTFRRSDDGDVEMAPSSIPDNRANLNDSKDGVFRATIQPIVGPDLALFRDAGIFYCPEVKILVCRTCKSCIKKEDLYGHFTNDRSPHRRQDPDLYKSFQNLGKKKFPALLKKLEKSYPSLTKTEVQEFRPPPRTAPFPFLSPVQSGYICRLPKGNGQPCLFAAPAESTLKRHRNQEPHGRPQGGAASFTTPGYVQRLCPTATGNTSFFPVDPQLSHSPASAQGMWYSAYQNMYAEGGSFLPQSVVDTTDPDLLRTFAHKSKWHSYLVGYSATSLRDLVKPLSNANHNQRVRVATLAYLNSIQEGDLDTKYFEDLRILNHWKHGRPAFNPLRKAESRAAYAILLQKLVRFSIRTARTQQTSRVTPEKEANITSETGNDVDLSDQLVNLGLQYATDDDILEQEAEENPEAQEAEGEDDDNEEEDFEFDTLLENDTELGSSVVGEDDYVQDDDETTPRDNDVQMSDSDDEVLSDNTPAYPVIMTPKQKQAALEFTQALKSGTDDELSACLHNLLLALFTDQLPEYKEIRSRTVVEAFLMSINLRRDGSLRPTENIAPDLSKTQYVLLLTMLKHAMRPGVDFKEELERLKPSFSLDNPCVFAAIRYYQHLAWQEVKFKVAAGRVFFYPNSPDFVFDGIPSSISTWIEMTHELWNKAESILRERILFGISFEKFELKESELVDNPRETRRDYGFAAGRTMSNGEVELNLCHIMDILNDSKRWVDTMVDELEDCKLSRRGRQRWLLAVKEFKMILFFLLHLTAGAPKRVTEILLHKLFNTPTRQRNVLWILRRMFILGDYSKTSATLGQDKKTIHVIPPAMQSSLHVFFMVVILLEMYILNTLGVESTSNAHCYLFASDGKRWKRRIVEKIIRMFTTKYLGSHFGIAKIRQLIPAMIRHYGLGVNLESSGLRIPAQMQGHTVGIANRRYGNTADLQGVMSNVDAQEVLAFSDIYHSFWGFGSFDGLITMSVDDLRAVAMGRTELLSTTGGTNRDCPECGALWRSLPVHIVANHRRFVYPAEDGEQPRRYMYRHREDYHFHCSCEAIFLTEAAAQKHVDGIPSDPNHPALEEDRPNWGMPNLVRLEQVK